MIEDSTIDSLKRDEGFMAKPYKDSEGLLTIGYGTLIEEGITKEEAELLLNAPSRHCDSRSWRVTHATESRPLPLAVPIRARPDGLQSRRASLA